MRWSIFATAYCRVQINSTNIYIVDTILVQIPFQTSTQMYKMNSRVQHSLHASTSSNDAMSFMWRSVPRTKFTPQLIASLHGHEPRRLLTIIMSRQRPPYAIPRCPVECATTWRPSTIINIFGHNSDTPSAYIMAYPFMGVTNHVHNCDLGNLIFGR